MRLASCLLLVLLCLGSSGLGKAATIRVARDGTGDYSVPVDAFMAATSADTMDRQFQLRSIAS